MEINTTTPGDGFSFPKVDDKVSFQYSGSTVQDGTVFHSSRNNADTPMDIQLGDEQVI